MFFLPLLKSLKGFLSRIVTAGLEERADNGVPKEFLQHLGDLFDFTSLIVLVLMRFVGGSDVPFSPISLPFLSLSRLLLSSLMLLHLWLGFTSSCKSAPVTWAHSHTLHVQPRLSVKIKTWNLEVKRRAMTNVIPHVLNIFWGFSVEQSQQAQKDLHWGF